MPKSAALLLALLLAGCASGPSAPAALHPPPAPYARHMTGPGGLTLAEEIGAVMMVGFRGALTPAVLEDWDAHQYGGLLVVNENANPDIVGEIARLRAVSRHGLLAATDQEGGTVCLDLAVVPCEDGAREAGMKGATPAGAEMQSMSAALKAQGFDVNLSPVADVWNGASPFMRDRSYGGDPRLVAADVSAAVSGVHAAGLLSAAKHFPGHGAADGDSHKALPTVSEDAATLRARDWEPFRAAVAAGVDFVMVGHLDVPALDPGTPSSLSPVVIKALREDIGFKGVIISDDLQMGGLTSQVSTPEGAVRFLQAGGDMVIVAHDPDVYDATYEAIREAVTSGRLTRERLDDAVRHLLAVR